MRLIAICLLATLVGCTTTRNITLSSRPPGATLYIDNVQQSKNPGTYQITWENDSDSHTVTANLAGYKERTIQLRRDDNSGLIEVELKPLTKPLVIKVEPVAATIKIDGRPVSPDLLSSYRTPNELDVSMDPRTGVWKKYTITAEREGFKTATVTASWPDNQPSNTYTLTMAPMDKEMSVTTTPTGANILFDDEVLGTSPIEKVTHEFKYDIDNNRYFPHKLKATLPGYPDQVREISYDDGQPNYHIDFVPSAKTIHIHTTPPGGIVTLEGKQYPVESNGDTAIQLSFPPVPGKNDLRTFAGEIIKPKTSEAEWYPLPITIAWDDGKTDYPFVLKEIRTMPVPLMAVEIERGDAGWTHLPKITQTVAGKSVAEPSGVDLMRLTPNEMKGKNIDALAISPDGKKLLFTVLVDKPELHSLMYLMPSDGSSAPEQVNDGDSLDITPSFSPDGDKILFSSDRAGQKLIVCAMSSSGGRAIEQYTVGQTTDLWPSMDSSPRARLFYEACSDRLQVPSIFSRAIDGVGQTDLGVSGGMKPRINAQNDAVLYECYNEKTRKRDIWRVSDKGVGGGAMNLTNSPNDDDYDAVWDRVGARIAYASDRGVDEDKNHNSDIWVMDLTQPNSIPQRITSNPSQDDHPVWDPSGRAIYFRSNRGGEWGIWKILVK